MRARSGVTKDILPRKQLFLRVTDLLATQRSVTRTRALEHLDPEAGLSAERVGIVGLGISYEQSKLAIGRHEWS